MSDMLVKLYDLPPRDTTVTADPAIVIRKPIGAESRLVVDWVLTRFGEAWAAEVEQAFANRPLSLFIAIRADHLVGFACYDATLRGMFGPIGVSDQARGAGVGSGLLRACLDDMRSAGYGYAVIGGAGPGAFFIRCANAVPIVGSDPGVYRGMLRQSLRSPSGSAE